MTEGGYYQDFLQTGQYPIQDPEQGLDLPYYRVVDTDINVPNQTGLISHDSPAIGFSEFADRISQMDLTFQARLYSVWRFADGSIYTLASVDWQVIFKAGLVNGVLTPDPTAVVSAQQFVRNNDDPLALLAPIFNGNYSFYSWG